MNNDESKMENKKILVSWFCPSFTPPNPSVSIITISKSESFYLIVSDHIHIPLVQALIVGSTVKPYCCCNNTLLIKYDLPVLYLPTTETIPTFLPSNLSKNCWLSEVIINPFLVKLMKGIAWGSSYIIN